MRRLSGVPLALLAVAAVFMVFGGSEAMSGGVTGRIVANAATGQLKAPVLKVRTAGGQAVSKRLPFIDDDTLQTAQDALKVGFGDERLQGADASADIPDSTSATSAGRSRRSGA